MQRHRRQTEAGPHLLALSPGPPSAREAERRNGMPNTPPKSRHHAEVASHIAGRLRVRLHRHSRHSHVLTHLQHVLIEQKGIHEVTVNHAAGSVTVKYDTRVHSGTGILGLLEDLDILVATVLDAPHLDAADAGGTQSAAGLTLAGALDDLDQRVLGLTGHTVNFRTLFPLSLAGLGVWQIWEQGLMIEMVPGWLLVWLAFDAFVKLHPPAPPARTHAASG